MIRNFRHRGLRLFFETGTTRGINPNLARRIAVRLDAMNATTELQQLNQPGWDFHRLQGDRSDDWSIHINGPWCLTFGWDEDEKDCVDVDLENYH